MNVQNIIFTIYLIALVAAVAIGLYKYKAINAAGKLLLFLFLLTLIVESLGFYLERHDMFQEPIYHFYSVIEIGVISTYFYRTTKLKYGSLLLYTSFVFWPVAAILNVIFFQPLKAFNSNFLLLESIVIIPMALYALYSILVNGLHEAYRQPAFWHWACFLIFWSSTFFFWAFIASIYNSNWPYRYFVLYSQGVLNIIVYAGFAFSFFLYSKKALK